MEKLEFQIIRKLEEIIQHQKQYRDYDRLGCHNDWNIEMSKLESELARLKSQTIDYTENIILKEQDNYPNMEPDGFMTDKNHLPD